MNIQKLYAATQLQAGPTSDEIRSALKHILNSAAFSHSPMLATFLQFVVETTLAGGADRIKAYTIAVDGLGRGSDFDPEADAIVRVHAVRIRRALKRYYAVAGADAMIIIDLPRRQYVPVFSKRLLPAALLAAPPIVLPRTLASKMADPASRSRQFVSDWIGKLLRRSSHQVDC